MDKEINTNGYSFVDLGLPSGTLWSTCNVGANKPSEYGLYFQWGDTKGYAADQVGKEDGKKIFSKYWDDYKWYKSGSEIEDNVTFKKYTTTGATLELEDDAANVHMGGDWHMPTPNQFQELIDYTKHIWVALDDVNGMKFTSKKDTSKFIFLPAAGFAVDGLIIGIGRYGFVWDNMLYSKHNYIGYELGFISFSAYLYTYLSRYCGLSVRGVIG